MNKSSYKEGPSIMDRFSWKSLVLVASVVLLCIYLAVDSAFSSDGFGDVVFCMAPFFLNLKKKLSEVMGNLDGEISDKLDSITDKLDKWGDDDEDEDDDDEDEDDEDEDEDEDEDDEDEDDDDDDPEARRAAFRRRLEAKVRRGEELTHREKFALSLFEENDQIEIEKERKIAEYDEQIEAEKRAKAEAKEQAKRERQEKREHRHSVLAKVGNAVLGGDGSSSNYSSSSSQSKKVARVYTCYYTGPEDRRAPDFIQVPSSNATGRPTGTEITEALKNLGYDDATAHALSNGGSDRFWKCK